MQNNLKNMKISDKNRYFTKNHRRFLMKAHVIMTVKYRKPLLKIGKINDNIINCINLISGDFNIDTMKSDINHIHLLINYDPKISVTQIIRKLKQKTTYEIWKHHKVLLQRHLWKEHTFWSDGYFVCSIGDACDKTIENYIKNQGN